MTAKTPDLSRMKIEDLGVLPEVVAQINHLAEQPSTNSDQVARLILRDPTLTTKILRIVNSTYYGLRQEVRSIQHAVSYLGLHQIRNLIISSALIESFRFDHGVVEPSSVWEHSLGCAIGAKRLGDLLDSVDGDGAYLGGLLHDLGRIAMLSKYPDTYAQVVNTCERGLAPLRDAEKSCFGVSHEQAGHTLGSLWGFSEAVLAMVRYHHRPEDAGQYVAPTAVVAVSNAICHREGLRFGFAVDDETADDERQHAWDTLIASHPLENDFDREAVEERVAESVRNTKKLVADIF